MNLLNKIPDLILHIVSVVLFVLYIVDNIVSGKIISNLKEMSVNVIDNTEEISEKVKKIISQKSGLHRRLVKAFPLIKPKVNIKEWLSKHEERINKLKNKIND